MYFIVLQTTNQGTTASTADIMAIINQNEIRRIEKIFLNPSDSCGFFLGANCL